MRLFVFITILILLAGCAPLTGNEYKSYALELIPPKTELVKAINKLNENGYECRTKTDSSLWSSKPNDLLIYCDRVRSGFMYGCVQRILLDIDEKTWQVISNTSESGCASL